MSKSTVCQQTQHLLEPPPVPSSQNRKQCRLCDAHDLIEAYEGLLFHFVKGEVKRHKGPAREKLTEAETAELEEQGVFLHQEQRKGTWEGEGRTHTCRVAGLPRGRAFVEHLWTSKFFIFSLK